MRSLAPLLLGAVVAAVTSVLVIAFYPTPELPSSSSSGLADGADASREIDSLHSRVIDLERRHAAIGTELADARERIALLESVAQGEIPRPDADPIPDPEPDPAAAASPESKPDEGQMEAAAKALAEKSRQQALDGIRAMLQSSDDYVLRQQQRIVQGVRDFAKEAGLTTEVARAVAYALIDVQKQSTHRLRAVLEGRDIEKLALEDIQPLIGEMFDARAQAMEAHLEPKQLEVFRAKETKNRARYDDWLKLAFPSRNR